MAHLLSTKCVLGISLDSCDASNFKRDESPYHLGAYMPVEETDKSNKYVHRTRSIVIWVKQSKGEAGRVRACYLMVSQEKHHLQRDF